MRNRFAQAFLLNAGVLDKDGSSIAARLEAYGGSKALAFLFLFSFSFFFFFFIFFLFLFRFFGFSPPARFASVLFYGFFCSLHLDWRSVWSRWLKFARFARFLAFFSFVCFLSFLFL
jgi:hypothetical protein